MRPVASLEQDGGRVRPASAHLPNTSHFAHPSAGPVHPRRGWFDSVINIIGREFVFVMKNVTIMQLPKQSLVLTMKISDVVPEPRPDLGRGRGRTRGRRRGSLPQLS